VDDGSSVSDFDEEEKTHRFSIDTTVLNFDHQGKHVNLLDTPGAPDFVGNALTALEPVENVVVVVSATSGVEVNTRRMFNEAGKRGLVRLIVINKCDAENVKFMDVYTAIRETFGKGCVLFNAPINTGPNFSGVVSVTKPPESAPAGCPVDLAAAHAQAVEAVIEVDDALVEKYFSEGDVTTEELNAVLPQGAGGGHRDPRLLHLRQEERRRARAARGTGARDSCSDAGEAAHREEEAGRRTGRGRAEVRPGRRVRRPGVQDRLRQVRRQPQLPPLYSGTIKADQAIINSKTERGGRSGGMMMMQGNKSTPITEAIAGDVVAVSKLEDLHVGDTVGTGAHPPRFDEPTFPTPLFALAVQPKARGDEQKISGSLAKIANEDPTFKVSRDAQTHELVITGMSQLHLTLTSASLKPYLSASRPSE